MLDVGCGDGILSAQLLQDGVRYVVALDADARVLARARARHPGVPIEWRCGDIFDLHPTTHYSFDAVLSVATLHHELVRPGGVVGVIGLAANNGWDLPYAVLGQCLRVAVGMTRGYWEHSAPMAWPPPTTYREIKRIAQDILPGVQYRRHFYVRYSLVWTRPGGGQHVELVRRSRGCSPNYFLRTPLCLREPQLPNRRQSVSWPKTGFGEIQTPSAES